MRLPTAILAALGLALVAGVASSEPIGEPALASIDAKAFQHWKAAMQAHGLLGLQDEIARCFAEVKAKPSQARLAWCVALDHYSLLDSMNFPEALQPPYFKTDAVFARLDAGVAQTTPAKDRREFARRLLVTLDETLHKAR